MPGPAPVTISAAPSPSNAVGDLDAAGEIGVIGEELAGVIAAATRAEHANVRAATGPGAGHDAGDLVGQAGDEGAGTRILGIQLASLFMEHDDSTVGTQSRSPRSPGLCEAITSDTDPHDPANPGAEVGHEDIGNAVRVASDEIGCR